MKNTLLIPALIILPLYGDSIVTSTNESELRAAVAEGGRITFSVDGTFLLTNQLEITKPTEIDGTSRQITISGQDQVRLFVISNTTAIFRSLTLSNGKVLGANGDPNAMIPGESALGAGIYSTMSTVLVENCSLVNHVVKGGDSVSADRSHSLPGGNALGSAIYFNGGRLSLSNAIVRRCSSTGGTGEVRGTGTTQPGRAEGGAIYTTNAAVLIHRTQIEDNVAAGGRVVSFPAVPQSPHEPGNGGGAYFTLSTVEIWESTISGNAVIVPFFTRGAGVTLRGGGIYSDHALTIHSCIFSNNFSGGSAGAPGGDAEGGAIFSSGTLQINGSFFAANRAQGGHATVFLAPANVGGDGHGGAIFATGILNITNSTLLQNAAIGARSSSGPGVPSEAGHGYGRGGALYVHGTNAALKYLTVLTNSAVTFLNPFNPIPHAEGGAIHVTTNAGAIVLGSLFAGNYVAGYFGETNRTGPSSASGPFTDSGWNLVFDSPTGFSADTTITNADPVLGPLGTHGGSTPVFPLLSGSPAIDAAQTTPDTPVDQRGRVRPYGAAADIGAYESSAPFFVMGKIRGYDVANAQISAPGSTSVPSPAGEYYLFFAEPGTNTITVQVEGAIVIPKSPGINVTVDQLLDFNSYQFNSVNAGSPVAGGIELIFAAMPNTSYVLEKSTDFTSWSEAGTFTTDADGIFRSNQSGQEEEFFRVRK